MELFAVLLDIAPMPPAEPSLWARFLAAVSAAVGGIVWSAVKLIYKATDKNKKEKK
ncbi:MAG: hypothetical protein IJE83_05250 [Oscillospiraceae bacterium]|nr:hypothetical protein [Oscillospiraceae bacterium]MBQ2862178.1 hypothetical protein [Oscillospiraceae bacterium]MBQ3237124.1 hypothetical protein [Oscillospiraceae bacterium]MBQ3560885.1 hypothetical protein [Oscillospiraceae bacterium]MBQ6701121.1 hypothetical protein [Oscillospiraceae bacterium]